jgi:hypothetical protein
MPGPNIHLSSMRHAANRLGGDSFEPPGSDRINPRWTGMDTTELGKLMKDHPNFASLGAIGPDLFFFLPDFRDETVDGVRINVSSVLITVLDFLESLYNTLDPYITLYEQYLGPISEDQAEEWSRLTGGLSDVVGNVTGDLSSILITALEDFVTQQSDWWSFFSLGLNKGLDEQAYFWSDMLHYRDTGQFGRAILKNAILSKNDGAIAYALGYLTHIGTDVTGHAFVNSISGGPFRLHWQRHHLVENHMDAFWYLNDPTSPASGDDYPQLTESALYFDVAFAENDNTSPVARPPYPSGQTLRDNYNRRSLLDIDSSMPDPLPDVLLQSMLDVWYPDGNHPKILTGGDGRPSADLIRQAYDLFYRYLKYVTVDGFNHEPPDPPDVFPNLSFPTISQPTGDDPPGDGGGGNGGGNFWDDLLDFILSVINAIGYALEVAEYLITLPWAIATDLATYPLRLGLYYALELPLFHMIKSFRAVMVMTGYMLPMDDEIAQTLIQIGNTEPGTFTQVLTIDGDVFGGLLPPPEDIGPQQTYRDANYPHSIPLDANGKGDEFRTPWSYPDSVRELHFTGLDSMPLTTSGPHAATTGPTILFGGVTSDPVIRDRFETAAGPAEADLAGLNVTPHQHLGDSVAFSEYLIWLESRDPTQKDGTVVPLVEWNLDSDCGYGYHCWDWNRKPGVTQPDPEGNNFAEPCTWPSQADNGLDPAAPTSWDPSVPLQIHWAGKGIQDPGCEIPGPLNQPQPRSAPPPRPKFSVRPLPARRKK